MSNPALIECDDEQRTKGNTDRMDGIRSQWCFSSKTSDSMFRGGNGFRWGCFIGQKNPAELRFHGNKFLWKVIWEIDVEMRAYVAPNVSFQSNNPQCLSHHPSSTEWRDSGPLLHRTTPRVNCFRFQGSCISPSGSFSKSGPKTSSTFAIGTSENNVVPFKSIPRVRHSQKCFQTLFLVSMRSIRQWTLVLTPQFD